MYSKQFHSKFHLILMEKYLKSKMMLQIETIVKKSISTTAFACQKIQLSKINYKSGGT